METKKNKAIMFYGFIFLLVYSIGWILWILFDAMPKAEELNPQPFGRTRLLAVLFFFTLGIISLRWAFYLSEKER